MKSITLVVVFLLYSFCGFSQTPAELASEIKTLRDELTSIKKDEWEKTKNEIAYSLEIGSRTEGVFKEYNTTVATTSNLLVALVRASNPNSQIFGDKSYTDIVIKKAEDQFATPITDPEAKTRLKDILTKIGTSPLMSIIGANPIGALVSTVVNSAASFLSFTKTGEKITAVKSEVNKQKIDAYLAELKPFIEYYNALNDANNNFKVNLAELDIERSKLQEVIPGLRLKLLTSLKLKEAPGRSLTVQFFEQYSDQNADYARYVALLKNPEIKEAIEHARKIREMDMALDQYKNNHGKAVAQLIKESKKALEKGIDYATNKGENSDRLKELIRYITNPTDLDDPGVRVLKSFSMN